MSMLTESSIQPKQGEMEMTTGFDFLNTCEDISLLDVESNFKEELSLSKLTLANHP